jgi:hypothetical protein
MRIRPPKSRSAAIERVRHRFEHWRRTRTPGRSRIPARLWAAAVALAGEHGVYATSRVLRLDYAVLKRRVGAASAGGSVGPASSHPTLIELRSTPSVAPSSVIEIEHPSGGRMRVPVPPVTVADLVALTYGVWKAGSAPR